MKGVKVRQASGQRSGDNKRILVRLCFFIFIVKLCMPVGPLY